MQPMIISRTAVSGLEVMTELGGQNFRDPKPIESNFRIRGCIHMHRIERPRTSLELRTRNVMLLTFHFYFCILTRNAGENEI